MRRPPVKILDNSLLALSHISQIPPGSHRTSFKKWGKVPSEDAEKWTTALPYFQTSRSIIPMSELPENDTHMGDGVLQPVNYLSSRSNAKVRMRADEGDAEAALDYGLR